MNEPNIPLIIEGCIRYIRAWKLPRPLPTNPIAGAAWMKHVSMERSLDEDAEDAWFELDRLVANEPAVGWRILSEVVSRSIDEDERAQIAAGPLKTFLHRHADAYSREIEEELVTNAGFREAYEWLQK